MKKAIRIALFALALGVFLVSGGKALGILLEYRDSAAQYAAYVQDHVQHVDGAFTVQAQPPAATPSPDKAEEEEPPARAPVEVDFAALQARFPQAVAWLYAADTPINYPVMQAADNAAFLHRLPDGTEAYSGSIFMDYRCAPDLTDGKTILYGHNMRDDSMFGTLSEYKQQSYYDAHPVLYLLTPDAAYEIALLGGCTVSEDDEAIYTLPQTHESRTALLREVQQRTTFQPSTQAAEEEQLIVLSTCTSAYDDARYVIIGALRKME